MYFFTANYKFSYDGKEWTETYSDILTSTTSEDVMRKVWGVVVDDIKAYIQQSVPYGSFVTDGTTATICDKDGNIVCHIKDVEAHAEYPPSPTVSLCKGDACRHSLTDICREAENSLRELLESGRPFSTNTCSCSKEPRSFRIMSDGLRRINVRTYAAIDEIPDIIHNAAGNISEKDERIIADMLYKDEEFRTEVTTCRELPITATCEDIVAAIDEMESADNSYLREMYQLHVVAVVDAVLGSKQSG